MAGQSLEGKVDFKPANCIFSRRRGLGVRSLISARERLSGETTNVLSGLRISEALALRWSDVDWLNGLLRVERGIVERNVDETKTDESRGPKRAPPQRWVKWVTKTPDPRLLLLPLE